MASKINKFLFTIFFFLFSITLNPPATTAQQECPYPCYPPPIGGSPNTPPATTIPPPAPPAQTGSNYPPPGFYSPPTQIIPNYNPSPPNNGFGATPPPDPMVPWFPYYYRRPLHPSSSTSLRVEPAAATGLMIFITMQLLVLPFFFLAL